MRLPWNGRAGGSVARGLGWLLASWPGLDMTGDLLVGAYGPMPIHGLVYWSGVWATVLLLAALGVTPLRVIVRWNGLAAARRIIGVAALGYTIFHVLTYFALDSWDFAMVLAEMSTLSINVVSATLSAVLLLALGATSFDTAVRRMGPDAWRRLHASVHLAAILAVVHFLLSRGIFEAQYVSAGILFWLLAWRILRVRASPGGLIALGLAAAAFTAVLEAVWMAVRHDADPVAQFAGNFDPGQFPSPAVEVLVLGLLVAAAGLARRAPMLRAQPASV